MEMTRRQVVHKHRAVDVHVFPEHATTRAWLAWQGAETWSLAYRSGARNDQWANRCLI